jgi:hypothetical protein
MSEVPRSKSHRHAAKTGQIYFGDPQERRGCLVQELNKFGAMIEVDLDVPLPEKLRLISAALALNQLCVIAWREGRRVGLRFAV